MKNIILSSRYIFIIAIVTTFLSSCSSWRYNHPRVQVEPQEPMLQQVEKPHKNDVAIVPSSNMDNNEESVKDLESVNEKNLEASIDKVTPVSQKPKMEIKTSAKEKPVVKKQKKGISFFTDKIFKSTQLFKVKEVEKSSVTGWVRLMIILFVVGFILCLIGIFLSVFLHPGFWWLFSFFGGLCIIAGFIVLILGLVGIML